MNRRTLLLGMAGTFVSEAAAAGGSDVTPTLSRNDLALLNRLTWGANESAARELTQFGARVWTQKQLHADPRQRLPRDVQDQIDALAISQQSVADFVRINGAATQSIAATVDVSQKSTALLQRQQWLNGILQQSVQRSLLRDIYSQNQLLEQMTWFWMNHFSIQASKRDIRLYIADFEDRAVRLHALGNFRALLNATARHPAMLRYLDNDQNAVHHSNENYARELMELHTLGINGGYTQEDVQALARILTGVGVDENLGAPQERPALAAQLIRDGEFEFNPAKHDYGNKRFLGQTIHGTGYEEVEKALTILAHHPSTANFISKKLAKYFVGGEPAPATVEPMAAAFMHTGGDIAQVLSTLFDTAQFSNSLNQGIVKDPIHYAVSATRLAYGDRIVRVGTLHLPRWIDALGEGLYLRETPDGYSLDPASWTGPGQLDQRFEFARAIGSGTASIVERGAAPGAEDRQPPEIQNSYFDRNIAPTLSTQTQAVLAAAKSPREWNALFLSSPEFMLR